MKPRPLAVATGLVAICLFLIGLQLDDPLLVFIAKPLPVTVMAGIAWRWGQGRYARYITAGLAVCVLGDVLLELNYLQPDVKGTFVGGMVAFLLGHVAYTLAFLTITKSFKPAAMLPFAVWIVWVIVSVWDGLGALQIPVTMYVMAIFVMLWRAASIAASREEPRWYDWAVMVGAIVFGFSDTLIALNKFHRSIEGVRTPIILTYWAGQALLCASTMRPASESERGLRTAPASET